MTFWAKRKAEKVAASRRAKNWDFPIREYVQSQTVYTMPEEEATPAIVWVSMEGGAE